MSRVEIVGGNVSIGTKHVTVYNLYKYPLQFSAVKALVYQIDRVLSLVEQVFPPLAAMLAVAFGRNT